MKLALWIDALFIQNSWQTISRVNSFILAGVFSLSGNLLIRPRNDFGLSASSEAFQETTCTIGYHTNNNSLIIDTLKTSKRFVLGINQIHHFLLIEQAAQ